MRRGAPLEHLWVVRDGRCAVPDTATVLREGSREYHEAMATARYVVANDHFPDWFERRDDQLCLQTWHGTPFKKLGFDVSDMRKQVRKFERNWDQQVRNWQYVLSPNRFSTPILRRAYQIEGEMLETGYPRVDVLARPDRDARARDLRRRLGLPEDKRIVLYAPTFRDHVVDRRNRFRLELALDLDRLREAVGEDTVILFRKHHYIIDPVPETADGFVRDVSAYPGRHRADARRRRPPHRLLVDDGRLREHRPADAVLHVRPRRVRGRDPRLLPRRLRRHRARPAAAHDRRGGRRAAGPRRRARRSTRTATPTFRETFCELDDGHAAARVVDRLF